jgi:hypothetical protein
MQILKALTVKMVSTFQNAVVTRNIVLRYQRFRGMIPKTIPKMKN